MKQFCTKCQKHVLTVTEDDEVNDESYEMCPLCGSDMYLTPSYGQKEKQPETAVKTNLKPFNIEEWNDEYLAWQERQERAIDAYHQKLEESKERADEEYYKTLRNEGI